jgi:predicted small lipoprotein YifL
MLQRKSSVAVTVIVLLCGLSACGQKGPLSLAKPAPSTGAASSPAAAR